MLCRCAGALTLGAVLLHGCSRETTADQARRAPVEISADSACALDGMLLADFPGPKGQIHYRDDKAVHWCCDTLELLSALRAPEQARPVMAAYVQDMGQADWDRPRDHWIDARHALYVLSSRRRGSMGVTAAPFSSEAPAKAFIEGYGGRLLRFDEIRPEMVDLSGGALHDKRM